MDEIPEQKRIPLYLKLVPGPPGFVKLDGEWLVLGPLDLLPEGELCDIRRYTTGEDVEVRVTEHLMHRRIRHRGDSEHSEYVLARFN